MTLNDYIKNLQMLQKEYGHLKVVYAEDDEGNGFNEIKYTPTLMYEEDNEYFAIEDDEVEYGIYEGATHVCVN